MPAYIALLRGINVSGRNKILMTDLKSLCESLGWQEVRSYIQSGNLVFTWPDEAAADFLSATLAHAIAEQLGLQVPVLVLSAHHLNALIAANPFLQQPDCDPSHLHLTLLGRAPEPDLLHSWGNQQSLADESRTGQQAIYLRCPGSYGETKLSNQFFETRLKVPATTRNWKTVLKLADMASAL